MRYSAMTFATEDEAYEYYLANSSDFVTTKEFPLGINYQIYSHEGQFTLVFARIEKQDNLVKAQKAKFTKMVNQSTPNYRMQMLLSFLKKEEININKLYYLFTTGRITCSNGVYEALRFVGGKERRYTIASFQETFYFQNRRIGVSGDMADEVLPSMSQKMVKSIKLIVKAIKQDMAPFQDKLTGL